MKLMKKIVAHARRRDVDVDDKAVGSEFLQWLKFANAGMMNRGNVRSMYYAITHLPSDAPIIEIGSFCGLSTNIMTHFKEKAGVKNKLITCDRWQFEGSQSDSKLGESQSVSHQDYRQLVKDSYIRNVNTFAKYDLPYTVEKFSDEFFEAWEAESEEPDVLGRQIKLGGPISFCFIDGNHTYEFARRDFENADRYLDQNGFILFDDSGDGTDWGVCQVVKEVMQSGRYELIARNPNYFFKKIA